MDSLGRGEVRLRGLGKRFGDTVALHPLDLVVGDGEFVVLVGPSGCGKTTVLRLVAGLDEPTAGEILIGGRDVTGVEPAERDIAMVFQNYALYPHKTVRENLAFGLRMRRRPAVEIDRAVARAAEVLGLQALLDRRPAQLSGGQKQRVAVGRALVREPSVFLFDEPLSNLDAQLRADLRRELADLHARLRTTMIYVTHDQVEAMTLGARIAVLEGGRLQQYAAALDIYQRPANLFVARFVGTPAINTVAGLPGPGRVISQGAATTFCAGDHGVTYQPGVGGCP
jgi:ABC-type sugar transport system ATPase subunit